MTRGLPEMEIAFFLREPRSCRDCKHSFYSADDIDRRYMRCGHATHSQQCRYERHESGGCGPAAQHWKARGI